ncbi:MAG: LamG domain-containing protein, partial [Planctomycetota bacterium]
MCKRLIYLAVLVLVLVRGASAKLVVHWRLDEGSGTTTFDSSGNGYDGTFVGTPQWVPGHVSAGALHFDGDAAASSVAHALGSATSWPTGAIALWVKVDSVGQDNYSGVFTNHFPNSAGIQIDVDGGNPGNYRINPSGLIFGSVTTDWIHLAVTFDNTSATLYYNGKQSASGTLSATNTTFNRFAIGLNRNAANWSAATIDELRVYDHALSAVEVLSTMSGEPWPYAYGPGPADGAKHEATWVTLSWKAGVFGVSHSIYLGDSFDDVNAGTGDTFRGNQTPTSLLIGFSGYPYPNGLVPGTTYYWRVDEVNEADTNSPWKGPIWSFSIPPRTAYNPNPADGAGSVALNASLSWTAGYGAKLHTVYFGDDFDGVSSAASGGSMVAATTYNPGPLKSAKVYYWRVDETDPPNTHKGQVWSFATLGAVGNPYPSNGASSAEMNAILTWTPGDNAASHQVYFGTDKEAVRKAGTTSPEYKGVRSLGAESFDPGLLAWDSTYYWRVDEVNSLNANSPWKGPLWSFATGDFLVVDDIES